MKTSCSIPHPLFTMDGVSTVDVEPVAVDVDDFFDVDGFSWGKMEHPRKSMMSLVMQDTIINGDGGVMAHGHGEDFDAVVKSDSKPSGHLFLRTNFFWTTRGEQKKIITRCAETARIATADKLTGQCVCLCAFVSLFCALWCNLQVSLAQLKILKWSQIKSSIFYIYMIIYPMTRGEEGSIFPFAHGQIRSEEEEGTYWCFA